MPYLRLLFLGMFSTAVFAGGNDPFKERCVFAVSGGISLSANDLAKGNDVVKPGFVTRMHFPNCGFTHLVLEYNSLFAFDLNETWVGVKARDYDANVFFGRVTPNAPSSFHAFTGLSVKTWEGTYTGVGENRITSFFVPVDGSASLVRFCANFGIALEKRINDLSLFGDFRFRISPVKENVRVEIMDIMYSAGLKYNLLFRKDDKHRKARFRMPGNKYNLD